MDKTDFDDFVKGIKKPFIFELEIDPSSPDPVQREKVNWNFYFHTSLFSFKRFYEGLKGFHKTFLGHHKEVWE